jgi:DNA modification methylase
MIQLHRGDCLEVMKQIPDGSVDLVLTDPPYGTMKGAALDGWEDNRCEWDNAINPADIFAACSRILRQNGKLILFSQEPYTSRLITEQAASLPFSYRAIWVKNVHANALLAKKAMVSRYEDVCIFQRTINRPPLDVEGEHPLREYFKRVLDYTGLDGCKSINAALGHRRAEHCFYVTGDGNGSTQFSLCTEQTYAALIDLLGISAMDGFIEYATLREIDKAFKVGMQARRDALLERLNKEYPSAFNLWQGGKSKSNVLEYAKDGGGYHPTQKPVALLEDLIKTFSNVGDTVLDFTMGSGSTGVACVNTGRDFIGIERDEKYFGIAEHRIRDATARGLGSGT